MSGHLESHYNAFEATSLTYPHEMMRASSTQSSQADSVETHVDTDARDPTMSQTTIEGKPPMVEDPEKAADGVGLETSPPPVGTPGAGFPDGGFQAWLCVFGSFFNLFVSFGWINCIGVFQTYYQTELLKDYPASTIAWIPSLETFVMFLMGPIYGRIFDVYGPRYLLLAGSFLHVFGLMMASISTEYYQILLAQGLCSSLGASAIFFPAINSVSTWFFHKRAFAIGIVASGSSLGGVIFPIMVQKLIPEVGFGWTMRACAFMILGMMIISNLTVRSRLPPNPKPFNIKLLYKPFSEPPFLLLALGSFLIFFGLFIPFDFLILQAEKAGVRADLATYLISILNALSIFGRMLPGYLGDKLGRFNMLTIFCYLSGIFILALWLPAHTQAPIIAFAALYGFASGAFVSMVPACLAQISPIQEIGVRNGSLFAFISIAALIGNPIAGALLSEANGSYTHLQIFAGVVIIAGATLIMGARLKMGGLDITKKL